MTGQHGTAADRAAHAAHTIEAALDPVHDRKDAALCTLTVGLTAMARNGHAAQVCELLLDQAAECLGVRDQP